MHLSTFRITRGGQQSNGRVGVGCWHEKRCTYKREWQRTWMNRDCKGRCTADPDKRGFIGGRELVSSVAFLAETRGNRSSVLPFLGAMQPSRKVLVIRLFLGLFPGGYAAFPLKIMRMARELKKGLNQTALEKMPPRGKLAGMRSDTHAVTAHKSRALTLIMETGVCRSTGTKRDMAEGDKVKGISSGFIRTVVRSSSPLSV